MHSIINDIEVTNTPNGMRNFYRRIKTNQSQLSHATRVVLTIRLKQTSNSSLDSNHNLHARCRKVNQWIIFIWLKVAAFVKFFVIRVRLLFKCGVYLKSSSFLANNSMVTAYYRQERVLVIVIFYIVFSFTICWLILMQYIKWIKFTQFQCHCPLHDPSSKDVTSDVLLRHQNWYI